MIILFNTVISGSILVFGRGTLRFILQPAMLVYRSVVFLGPYHSISISLWNLLAPKKCRVHFSDLKKLGCFPLPQVASHIFCGILGRRTIRWRVSCMLLFACQTTSDHHPKSGKSPWYVPKWPMPRVCYEPPIPPIRWRRQMISSSNPERFDPSQTTWKKSIRVVIPRTAFLQHYTVCLQAASAKRTIGEARGKYQQSTFCCGGRCRIFHRIFWQPPTKMSNFLVFCCIFGRNH